MNAIPFTKASACGNTFLLIEGRSVAGQSSEHQSTNLAGELSDLRKLSRRLCDPNFGVGADGVEWLFPDTEADVMARLFNADGSEAEISGNGTRCVAADICSRLPDAQLGNNEIIVRTGAGLKICRLIVRRDSTFEFETDMGEPLLNGELLIETMRVRAKGTRVSMGNPHFVIFEEAFPDDWQPQAGVIGTQPQFSEGTNVEYVVVRGTNEIEIRLFERGVGETQSSGTGSCAAAVAAITAKRVTSPVSVIASGGTQIVRWEDHVYLRGSATIVCRGEVFI
jgi:diaminopimelate epimerase